MSTRADVLLLFSHPALQSSRVHTRFLEAARLLAGVTVNDLYQEYPDFDIDVPREQALLEAHSRIVLQHPLYWYSTPALLKQWQDLVLEHGWAYGRAGTALRGKQVLSVVTVGGREEAYRATGLNRRTVRELLAPIEQTVRLCGMSYLPPVVMHGIHQKSEAEVAALVPDYVRVLQAFRAGELEPLVASEAPWLDPATLSVGEG